MLLIRRIAAGVLAGAMLGGCNDDSTGPGDLTPVASLEITLVQDTLLTRQRVKLQVRAFDREGSPLPDRPVTWESVEAAIASVSAGGVLTALAPGTTVIRATTENVVDSVTVTVRTLPFTHVFAGSAVSCGLEASGRLWCWGYVGSGGYGNGSLDTTLMAVPTRAAIGHTFTSLAFANRSACGITTSGDVLCWGQNERGQLGDGSTTPRGTPAPVNGLTGVVQLEAGFSHFCARSGAGAVSCWGSNEWSQTGQPNHGIVVQPALVALDGAASDVTTDWEHSCALVGGQSFCWGSDAGGQLGNDTTYHRLVPTLAGNGDGVTRTWSEVEASNQHTCGRDAGGAVFCWGVLPSGVTSGDTLVWLPTRRFEGLVATDMAGGWEVQCAVSDQRALCDGHEYPRVELSASGPVSSVVVAGDDACVLYTNGAVACELSSSSPYPSRGTLHDISLPAPAVQLAASDSEVCALDNVGAVYCWFPEIGPATQRKFQGLTATGVYANSGSRICVIAQSTTVACRDWFSETETTEPTGGRALIALAVGDYHTCGLTAAGGVWCWGENTYGQLGDGTMTNRAAPVAVQGGHLFSQITAGLVHTCGLTTAGTMYCWGYGSNGSMGDDKRDESAAPVDVDGTPVLTQLSGDTCGLEAAGTVWCWPRSFDMREASQVGGATGLVSLSGPCGLRAMGEMLCWGYNLSARFGNGLSDVNNTTAVVGGNGIRFAEVSFGGYGSACGIGVDGVTYCWGNMFGKSVGSPEAIGEPATLPLKVYGSP